MRNKAVALLSGGLDSTLAVKIMLELKVEVVALNFITPFCCCTRGDMGCKHQASKVAREFGIPIKVISNDREYLEVVRYPKHGYGKNLNPCIDCRIFMHKVAKDFMEEIEASFLITGEVLRQRPMSQRRDAMNIIERESSLMGYILRPLSAKLLPPTVPEIEGLVDREKLLSLSGRSRKPQMSLAREYGIDDYPCPAGGCLLTDKIFSKRMRDLFEHSESLPDLSEVRALRVGRHFRLSPQLKVIVGRNHEENESLSRLARPHDYTFKVQDHSGPLVVAQGEIFDADLTLAARISVRYSGAPSGKKANVAFCNPSSNRKGTLEALGINEEKLETIRIE